MDAIAKRLINIIQEGSSSHHFRVNIVALAADEAPAGAEIPAQLLPSLPSFASLFSHLLPFFPLTAACLIADIKMAKCCPLMGRDIPGVAQMSVLPCGNPTLVESIFPR